MEMRLVCQIVRGAVWIIAMASSKGSGESRVDSADLVLDEFDVRFPEVKKTAADKKAKK